MVGRLELDERGMDAAIRRDPSAGVQPRPQQGRALEVGHFDKRRRTGGAMRCAAVDVCRMEQRAEGGASETDCQHADDQGQRDHHQPADQSAMRAGGKTTGAAGRDRAVPGSVDPPGEGVP